MRCARYQQMARSFSFAFFFLVCVCVSRLLIGRDACRLYFWFNRLVVSSEDVSGVGEISLSLSLSHSIWAAIGRRARQECDAKAIAPCGDPKLSGIFRVLFFFVLFFFFRWLLLLLLYHLGMTTRPKSVSFSFFFADVRKPKTEPPRIK